MAHEIPLVQRPALRDQTETSSILDWLALTHVETVGSVRAQALVERFGSARGAFLASGMDLEELRPALGKEAILGLLAGPNEHWAQEQARQAYELGATVLALDQMEYPQGLRSIPSPPPVLFLHGTLELSHPRSVAVVGTREPSELGLATTHALCQAWAAKGIRIVSGLARGIDEQAHRSTLAASGQTVAVLGCPLDGLGMFGRGRLAQEISQQGLLVSEHPFGAPVTAPNFARRNRIISGLSQAVVVAQAPRKSGALITARHALDQDRELLACPGPAGDLSWEGCFDLLRQGARLCAHPDDLLDSMGWVAPSPSGEHGPCDSLVVKLLRGGDSTAEEIALRLKIPISSLQGQLVLLEMSGSLSRAPGGRYTVRS
jgi:DNA processing protein